MWPSVDEIIEIISFNVAKLFGNTKWFIMVSFLIIICIYFILKFRGNSIKYFIIISLIYLSFFGSLFFKGIRVKNIFDSGKQIVKIIYDYKKENSNFPNNLEKIDIKDKELLDSNFLNCCVEYKVNDSTLVKIEDDEGYHYKSIPGEFFTLIIWPDNFPRYFIYNSNEKEFKMTEIQHSKNFNPTK